MRAVRSSKFPKFFSCTLLLTLLPGSATLAGLTPLSQSRSVWARSVAGGAQPPVEDQQRLDAPDLGTFAASAIAEAAPGTNFFATTVAEQFSVTGETRLLVKGRLDSQTGDEALAEASSDHSVSFRVDTPQVFTFSYDLNVDFLGMGTGGMSLSLLRGREGGAPVVTPIELTSLQDARGTVTGTLAPGEYTLDFSAFMSVDQYATLPYEVSLDVSSAGTLVPLPAGILSGGLLLCCLMGRTAWKSVRQRGL
jgi:hypothetical protein